MVGSPRSGYRYLGGPLWVDIVAFEKVGLVALERAARLARDKEGVAITDEIADMGLASARFVQSLRRFLLTLRLWWRRFMSRRTR